MEARTSGEPFLATIQIKIVGQPASKGLDLWDWVMERLTKQPGIIDPIVSNDLDKREVVVSFEFDATGDVRVDVPKALELLVEATRSDDPPESFDWEKWLGSPASAGTVQYPVLAS